MRKSPYHSIQKVLERFMRSKKAKIKAHYQRLYARAWSCWSSYYKAIKRDKYPCKVYIYKGIVYIIKEWG